MSTVAAQKAAVDKSRTRFLNAPKASMLQHQELTAKGSRVKGPFRTEQVSVPAPSEQNLWEQLWGIVSDLRVDGEIIERPDYTHALGGEWTDLLVPPPPRTPRGDYGPSRTMLYFHGGSYKYSSSCLLHSA